MRALFEVMVVLLLWNCVGWLFLEGLCFIFRCVFCQWGAVMHCVCDYTVWEVPEDGKEKGFGEVVGRLLIFG